MISRVSQQKSLRSVLKQSQSSSSVQKRLRSLTVESDHDYIRNERDEVIQNLQAEYSLRQSLLVPNQQDPDVESDLDANESGISLKSVWNGFKSAFI